MWEMGWRRGWGWTKSQCLHMYVFCMERTLCLHKSTGTRNKLQSMQHNLQLLNLKILQISSSASQTIEASQCRVSVLILYVCICVLLLLVAILCHDYR